MSIIYGRGAGAYAEYDLKKPDERKAAISIGLWVFIPVITAIITFPVCIFTNHMAIGSVTLIICVFVAILGGANALTQVLLSDVSKNIVTYEINTINDEFRVMDSYGRDVTVDYQWTVNWVRQHRQQTGYNPYDGLYHFSIYKVKDREREQPEIVDIDAVRKQVENLQALKFVIWGIAACFTFIPFIPLIPFSIGEKKYPDSDSFRKTKGISFKLFAWIWSLISLVAWAVIILLFVFVIR